MMPFQTPPAVCDYMVSLLPGLEIDADAFADLWEYKGDMDSHLFLFVKIKYSCFNYLKHSKRKVKHFALIEEMLPTFIGGLEIKSDLINVICNEIEAAPLQQKRVMKLIYQGCSQVEISEILHMAQGTVNTHVKRFRDKIKQII